MSASGSRARRPPGRPAGDGANREAILDAAKTLFAAHGYDGASMRAIASAADVDPALIRHFFIDKSGLFAATIAARSAVPERLAAAFDGDAEGLGERLTRAYLAAWADPETGPAMRAIVRTAFTSERYAELLQSILTARIIGNLPDTMATFDDVPMRIMLAGSHLLGIAAARHLTHAPALATLDDQQIVAIVAPAVQRYLTEPLPTGGN